MAALKHGSNDGSKICFYGEIGIVIHKLSLFIGVQRFRILVGGGGGGTRGCQIPSRHMTSMRRNDVASTSFQRHVPTRFLINQCQLITFLILKSDNIENSKIELKGIVL